ncbi:hypothetical protein L7F22_051702 [Adiantum nelumboides]|nr:hypothetical protein [Adiantum nelumboides]
MISVTDLDSPSRKSSTKHTSRQFTIHTEDSTLARRSSVPRVLAPKSGAPNGHFVFANATVSLGSILSTYPGTLKLVTISCPDPHFKTRHHKRRIVQVQLVDSIINSLAPGGQVFLQSDVKEVAEDMRHQFNVRLDVSLVDELQANPSVCDVDGWLLDNPLGIRSEREIHALARGGQVFRKLYTKVS